MVADKNSARDKKEIYTDEQKKQFITQFKELIRTSPKYIYDEFNRKPKITFKPHEDVPCVPIASKFEGKLKEDYLKLVDRLIKGSVT